MNIEEALEHMVRKFTARAPLADAACAALRALPFSIRSFEPSRYLVREGQVTEESSLILSGYAFRQKVTADGDRQIVSIHIPGDFVDLEGSLLRVSDHAVQCLTRVTVATVARASIVALIDEHPPIGRAMWIDTLVDAAMYREWVVNVGRRPAPQRIGHLLCEFARRLQVAGLGDPRGYEFPMTQEQLADATGLTPVHVNRTLKLLEEEGYIQRRRRHVQIPDWNRLRTMSGFSETYLHLDQKPGTGELTHPQPER